MKTTHLIFCLVPLLFALPSPAQLDAENRQAWVKMRESKAAALNEFNDAKFGLFLHWGLYSELGGEWRGQKIPGLTEWIMYHAKIPKADYLKLASSFNPVK